MWTGVSTRDMLEHLATRHDIDELTTTADTYRKLVLSFTTPSMFITGVIDVAYINVSIPIDLLIVVSWMDVGTTKEAEDICIILIVTDGIVPLEEEGSYQPISANDIDLTLRGHRQYLLVDLGHMCIQ
jgi:hypothetical protein